MKARLSTSLSQTAPGRRDRTDRWRRWVLLGLVPLLLLASSVAQRQLNVDREKLGLTSLPPLENAPPVLAFTTVALGGFRGLIANALWIRATKIQEEGKYFEMVQLADWITKLQPTFVTVWNYQSWNMAYNISVKFKAPHERWLWIKRGIELLRDQALVYNPQEALLYHELARLFQHKVGYYMDDAHIFYKQQWAEEMTRALGGERPNFDELLNPQSTEALTRARTLREVYKLDPQLMQLVDQQYGPLEWRLPESHAIYWAKAGLLRAHPKDQLALRRVIYQALRPAFERGRLIANTNGLFEVRPNLAILPKVNAAYEEMMRDDPENQHAMLAGYRNFLKDAVYFLYVHNRLREAEGWLKTLRVKFPEAMPADMTVDQFAVERINELIGRASVDKTRAIIEGMLTSSLYYLALGETDQAGYDRLAQHVWRSYQARIAGQEGRVGLPPLAQMRQDVVNRMLDPKNGLLPELQAQLRSALGVPAPQ